MPEQTCLRCGTPYDDGATVCFTCGASIGELETPTQPVRTPRVRAAQATPHEIPLTEPVATEASGELPDPALAAAPKRMTVGTSVGVAPAPVPQANRKTRPAALIAVAVVLLALIGGGAYIARNVLAGPPTPKSVIYHDARGRFQLVVPALWSSTQQSSGVLLSDSSGANTVTITITPAQTGETATTAADTLATQQHLQPAQAAQIGGDAWEQRTGQVTGVDGATRIVALYVDVHNGQVYAIQCTSPTASYTNINNLVYQPLLASFAFGS